jgi:hypothetical protein
MSRLSQKNTPCRYDERMTLKEDYDYTAEVLAGPADGFKAVYPRLL